MEVDGQSEESVVAGSENRGFWYLSTEPVAEPRPLVLNRSLNKSDLVLAGTEWL